ncbi:expressed unknown protein [Seminavis robusta]|uniref:DUF4105 domain-containing protein n=1 Tax=Seminavis robusta TaxID=568900 RepID=A0A9N8DHE1_9STRA|nr:expressed unknown protein [Seminavis robusta]|eukprot:Sro122_g059240.1 n/a (173) ;mRNA; r:61189-61707
MPTTKMVLLFCWTLLLPTISFPTVSNALQQPTRIVAKPRFLIAKDSPIQLECCPLIGGPSWLPLHVQVAIVLPVEERQEESKYKFDFVPQQATEPATLLRLLTLKAVPGELRCFAPRDDMATLPLDHSPAQLLVQQAQEFQNNQADPNLHLLRNNCWTFAWRLLRYLKQDYR